MSSAGGSSQQQQDGEGIERPIPEYNSSALEHLFGDHTRVKVLTVFLHHPSELFLQKQISEAINVSTAMVSRATCELVDAGIVERVPEAFDDRYDGYRLADTPATNALIELADVDDDAITSE